MDFRPEPGRQAFQCLAHGVEITGRKSDATADDDAWWIEREMDIAAKLGSLACRRADDVFGPRLAGGCSREYVACGGTGLVFRGLAGYPVAGDLVFKRAGNILGNAELPEMAGKAEHRLAVDDDA